MCARYELSASPRMIMERFALDAAPPVPNKQEMRPTDQALVIGRDGAGLLRWGLEASWDGRPLINARAETLAEKATFRPLLENRCLVPMTAYFEWRQANGRKLKNRISVNNGDLAAFAGLTDGRAFTIVTCAPAPAIAHVHDRMPVILDPADASAWADPNRRFAQVAPLLVPYAGGLTAAEDAPPAPAQGSLFA